MKITAVQVFLLSIFISISYADLSYNVTPIIVEIWDAEGNPVKGATITADSPFYEELARARPSMQSTIDLSKRKQTTNILGHAMIYVLATEVSSPDGGAKRSLTTNLKILLTTGELHALKLSFKQSIRKQGEKFRTEIIELTLPTSETKKSKGSKSSEVQPDSQKSD